MMPAARPHEEPRRKPSLRLGLLLFAVLSSVAACGSGASGVGQAFADRASAVCAHALALKQAQGPFPVANFNPTRPDPAKLAEVAVFLHGTDATFTTWVSELVALGAPPSGQAPWADLVAAATKHRDNNRDQIAAAERGDTATFAADYDIGVATHAKFQVAATAAGVPRCATNGPLG